VSRLGEFIDVHVTRAQQVVALIVGLIAIVSAVVGGVVYVKKRLAGPEPPPELSWAGEVVPSSNGNRWGPDRPTYSAKSPPLDPKLNSIKDQPGYGDERDFFRVRNVTAGTDWSNSVELRRKDQFEASVYFHNDSDQKAANYTYAQVEIPAIVRSDEDETNNFALAYVRASNAQPSEVHDSVSFINNTDGDFALRYVPGTARFVSDTGIDGTAVNADSLFHIDGPQDGGVRLGADTPDGVLPPGASGRIVWQFVAEQPGFDFENRARLDGTKEWKRDVSVNPGDSIEFQLSYTNTGDTEQRDVVLKAVWPQGLEYNGGKTELWNSNSPSGRTIGDGIAGDGVNIGHYAAGANALLFVRGVTVTAPPCSVLELVGAAETNNGNEQASSTIRVSGSNCPAP